MPTSGKWFGQPSSGLCSTCGGFTGFRIGKGLRENGLRIAKHTGANKLIVELFAFLHDCCREDERSDPGHGERAAQFAESLRGTLLRLDDQDSRSCTKPSATTSWGGQKEDVTVVTCWDADRLDLGRVRIRPRADCLCTESARRKSTIEWAYRRSLGG